MIACITAITVKTIILRESRNSNPVGTRILTSFATRIHLAVRSAQAQHFQRTMDNSLKIMLRVKLSSPSRKGLCAYGGTISLALPWRRCGDPSAHRTLLHDDVLFAPGPVVREFVATSISRTAAAESYVGPDVNEKSMQRLAPQLGAWPSSRDVHARAARFSADHGTRNQNAA